MSSIVIERTYPHAREKVWRAITDPDLLARWLMPNDFRPEVGHRFTFRTDPGPGFDGVVRCEVQQVDEPNRLVFTWVGGPIDTVVTFTLHEDGGHTRFVMEQAGFKGLKAWLVSQMLRVGSRVIYGKRLPALLDDMAKEPSPAGEGDACMEPSQSLIKRMLGWLERKN